MKVNELCVGCYVMYNNNIFQVTDISRAWPSVDKRYNNKPTATIFNGGILTVGLDEIIPVEINEEFLKWNGFELDEKMYEDFEEKYYELKLEKFTITIHEDSNTIGRDWWVHIDNDFCCTIASADVQYVHQFQNLLNILDIEFEVKL